MPRIGVDSMLFERDKRQYQITFGLVAGELGVLAQFTSHLQFSLAAIASGNHPIPFRTRK